MREGVEGERREIVVEERGRRKERDIKDGRGRKRKEKGERDGEDGRERGGRTRREIMRIAKRG